MSREAPPSVDEARLRAAYELLRSVVAEKAARSGSVRDSEVKRQMVEKEPDFDEAALGFRKFSRFLRQAHDEEVINLERTGEGNYKISAVDGGQAVARTPQPESAGTDAKTEAKEEKSRSRGQRDRAERSGGRRSRGSRGARKEPAETAPPADEAESASPVESTSEAAVEAPVPDAPATEPAPSTERVPSTEPSSQEAAPTRLTGRKRRSPKPKAGPTVVPGPVDSGEAPTTDVAAEVQNDTAPARPTTRTMGRFRRGSGSRGPGTAPAASPGAGSPQAENGAPRSEPVTAPAADLSSGQEDMVERMARGYQGVGRRTAERLVEEFGDRVLDVIDNEPGRIESVLPKARAQAVIDGRRAEREAGEG